MEAKFGALDKKIKKRLTSIEMKFFDHKRKEEISEEFKVEPVDEYLRRYK